MVIMAARLAREGRGLKEIVAEVNNAIPNTHLLALFDTLKYLLLGGRIGKARALLGSVLNVKPMLSLKDGETVPAGQVRTRSKGMERLLDFVKSATDIEDLSVIYSTTPDEAQSLAERISTILPDYKVNMGRIGPLLGVHMGPGALIIAIRGKLGT
jgi:DegV family protein with EDD domain